MSYLPITSEISGQFLIRLHGKAEIVGALDGHFLVYFGDRTGFVVQLYQFIITELGMKLS